MSTFYLNILDNQVEINYMKLLNFVIRDKKDFLLPLENIADTSLHVWVKVKATKIILISENGIENWNWGDVKS